MTSKTAAKKSSHAEETQIHYDQIRAGDLVVDHRVQRDHLKVSKLNKIRKNFNTSALGTLVVSRRPDGTYALLDGQHRWTVVLEECGDDFPLNCQVHTGLSLAHEAALFIDLNVQDAASPLDLHKARVTLGNPMAVAISEAVGRQGWQIGVGKGSISAIKALESLYDAGENWYTGYGQKLVEKAIYIVTEAWGHDNPKAVSQYILKAVGVFVLACEQWAEAEQKGSDYMDWEGLAFSMATTFKGGPASWLATARGYADNRASQTLQEAMCEELYRAYNKGRRERKLPGRFLTRYLTN